MMEEQKSEGQLKNFCYIFNTFRDASLEKLYQNFSVRQKRAGLECFVITAILFDIYMLAVPSNESPIVFGVISAFLVLNCGLLFWCRKNFQNKRLWLIAPHIAFHIANGQILCGFVLERDEVISRDSLGWFLLLTYLIYVTLPLRLIWCALLSIATSISYMTLLRAISEHHQQFTKEQIANSILLLTANILGLTSFLVEDIQQRRAFLETRQSLEMKLVIEEQSTEQERLLLSVLPEHVAVQMRQDLDRVDSQFKKIYMSRHENVSILYADIVGFTAISSTYSAQDLVKMLNDLFARFDKLAEKYQQLRIKILGDCYYCISGAPVERPDHAVLCVHMGLSMVKAIKYVQETCNSPVDMRVGIHTGAVLAGVLGQRQWQFDVYSKDVELANKMESSGKAGRVHISATTLSYLNGEFQVEPAYGEKRDEALRIAGLKTYFIVKVLKPFQPSGPDVQNGGGGILEDIADILDGKEEASENKVRSRQDSTDFKARLRTELVNRDGHRELEKNTKFLTQSFLDERKERSYQQRVKKFSSIILLMLVLVRLSTAAISFLILPKFMTLNIVYYFENSIFILIAGIILSLEYSAQYSLSKCCEIKESAIVRMILFVITMLILAVINILTSVSCAQFSSPLETTASPINCSIINDMDSYCLYPSYFSYFALLILIASSLPVCLSYIWTSTFLFKIALAQIIVNLFILDTSLECEEMRKYPIRIAKGKYTLSILLLTATIALTILSRHMEQVARVLYLWRCEVEEQRDFAEDMRRRNEALVYNILPPHVAAHFMGNRNRQHDELYSQSYAEVGVLFASMPNFSDFYSEETVNNQGLECLRFLNEVISDFDALLELPQFQNVIKIKTIGSTYMAASGLNSTKQFKPDDPIVERWAHLALLVEFALELKKALQSINEQSFNHFVLKLGINHGPITAGVIGARKPHYDIWGNTVNVASRMESTGKAGCIQVTEETCEILQNFGYKFEQRGLVAVKGKGQLMTYYLMEKAGKITPPTAPVSPILGGSSAAMETVNEEDESHDSLTSKSEEKTVIECSNNDSSNSTQNFTNDDMETCGQNFNDKEAEPLLHD